MEERFLFRYRNLDLIFQNYNYSFLRSKKDKKKLWRIRVPSSITTLKTIFKRILLNARAWNHLILDNITSPMNVNYFMNKFRLRYFRSKKLPLFIFPKAKHRIFTIARVYGSVDRFFPDVKIFDRTWRHYVANWS